MKRYALIPFALTLIACGQLITPKSSPTVEPVITTPSPVVAITLLPTVTSRPTATPRPATPEPTPTSTMTPTPTIYTVQPGDVLGVIAQSFDISTEALQIANGIIDPRTLQIGQQLIIPPPEDDSGAPTPTPTPFPADVRGVNFIENPPGTLWAFGDVVNPGNETLSELVVEINLFDADGKLLASQAAFTALDVLPEGQSVPFAIPFDTPPSSFAQYQARVVAAVPLLGNTRYYLDLNPIEVSAAQIADSSFRITGQLENSGTSDTTAIKLVVVAYDDNGKMVAQRQVSLAVKILRSNARTPFEVDLIIPQATVTRYEVQAQGLQSK